MVKFVNGKQGFCRREVGISLVVDHHVYISTPASFNGLSRLDVIRKQDPSKPLQVCPKGSPQEATCRRRPKSVKLSNKKNNGFYSTQTSHASDTKVSCWLQPRLVQAVCSVMP